MQHVAVGLSLKVFPSAHLVVTLGVDSAEPYDLIIPYEP